MANPIISTTKVQFHSVPILSTALIETGHFYHDQSTDRFYLALGQSFPNDCKELTNEDVRARLNNLVATQVGYSKTVGEVVLSNVGGALDDIYSKLANVAVKNDLDGSATIATATASIVTIKGGVSEVDGIVSNDATADDIILAKVAVTGNANDVAYSNSALFSSTVSSVKDALDNIRTPIDIALDGYATEAYVGSQIAAITASETLASQNSNTIFIPTTLTQEDGVVSIGSTTIELADVAATGAAADVAYDNTESGLTAEDVQAAIDELAEASAGGVSSKTVYMTEDADGDGDYVKIYKIYQGSTGSSASPVAGELIGTINIPKDLVVTSGTVGTVTVADEPYEGAVVGDKYIDLTIANQSEHLYIPANSLVDIYTAQQNASQVQLAIDGNNVISATIVAGSIDTTELANGAVTTAKLAEGAVTSTILASGAVTAAKIADGAVGSVALASGAVQTANIGDEQVTEAKLSSALIAKIESASGVSSIASGTADGTIAVTTRDGATGSTVTSDVAVTGLQDTAFVALSTLGGTATASTASATSQTSNIKALTDFAIVDGVLVPSSVKSVNISSMISAAKNDIIGTASDTASDNTIYGAKKYADSKELVWQVTA